MSFVKRPTTHWRLRTREIALGARTLVMGVVNVTPDSFSDGGKYLAPEAAVAHALQLLDEGADILDLGGESTRPGSHAGGADAAVTADEEQARVLPVVEGILKARPRAVLSIDTYKAATARVALAAGAEIVNDVSGFAWDAEMAAVCATTGAGVVAMHTRGKPDEWKQQAHLAADAVLASVRRGLSESLARARTAGIRDDAVVLDPGYGFGKRQEENFALLARQAELLSLGRPLLVGMSRKSFLGWALRAEDQIAVQASERENAHLAALTAAILNGASVVRVHAVKPAVEAARVADAVLRGA